MTRSSLRTEIATRIEGAMKTAKDAAMGGSNSFDKYKSLQGVFEDKGVLVQQIKAEVEIANQLEQLRIKGVDDRFRSQNNFKVILGFSKKFLYIILLDCKALL